jgi:hypothetical protein
LETGPELRVKDVNTAGEVDDLELDGPLEKLGTAETLAAVFPFDDFGAYIARFGIGEDPEDAPHVMKTLTIQAGNYYHRNTGRHSWTWSRMQTLIHPLARLDKESRSLTASSFVLRQRL